MMDSYLVYVRSCSVCNRQKKLHTKNSIIIIIYIYRPPSIQVKLFTEKLK